MPLAADRELTLYASQELVTAPVDDNVIIYKNAFVGRNRATGYARPLVAGDDFLGIAYQRADNTLPGHVAGGVSTRLHQLIDVIAPLAGAVLGDVGRDVYASSDDVLTASPLLGSRVGRIVALEAAVVVRVRCQPASAVSGVGAEYPVRLLADLSQTLTLDQLNCVLLIANTAARTLTLPPVASARAGSWMRVIKTSAAAFAVTLDGSGAETIDGATTLATIDAAYDAAHLICTGFEWVVAARDIA